MKAFLLYCLLLLSSLTTVFGQNSPWRWASQIAGSGPDAPHDIITGNDGSIYVAGEFYSDTTFTGSENQGSDTNGMLARFNASGQLQWRRQFGSSQPDYAKYVAVDGHGHVYVAGIYQDTAAFGQAGGTEVLLRTRGGYDAFLAKYTAAGQLVWARSWGGVNDDEVTGLAVDAAGRAYLTGYFWGASQIGDEEFISNGPTGGYIAAFTPDGEVDWVNELDAEHWLLTEALAQGEDGTLVVAGRFEGTLDAGSGSSALTGKEGSGSLLLLYYHPDSGEWLRGRVIPGSSLYHRIRAAELDAQGAVTLAGEYWGIFQGPASTVTSINLLTEDIFVLKIQADGTEAWLRTGGGFGPDAVSDLVQDAVGNVYLTGYLSGDGDFGDLSFNRNDDIENGYFLRLSAAAGTPDLLLGLLSASSHQGKALTLDANGDLLLAGSYANKISLGQLVLFGSGAEDIFVVKYDLDVVSSVHDPLQNDRLGLFPNPSTTATVQVDLSRLEGTAARLVLVNSVGQAIRSEAVASPRQQMLLGVVPGLYLVQVQGADGRVLAARKLVVR